MDGFHYLKFVVHFEIKKWHFQLLPPRHPPGPLLSHPRIPNKLLPAENLLPPSLILSIHAKLSTNATQPVLQKVFVDVE